MGKQKNSTFKLHQWHIGTNFVLTTSLHWFKSGTTSVAPIHNLHIYPRRAAQAQY